MRPPAIELPLPDDPEIVRNLCLGRDIVALASGFGAEVLHVEGWAGDNVQIYLWSGWSRPRGGTRCGENT